MLSALFDLSSLKTGSRVRGIGRYVVDLGLKMAELGPACGVRVLGLEEPCLFSEPRVAPNVKEAIERLAKNDEKLSLQAWAMKLRLGLGRSARAASADLIHTPEPRATPFGRVGAPRVTTCHDLIPLRFPEKYENFGPMPELRRLRERRRYLAADHVIAVSETTAHDLVSMLGLPARRITVVHNGIDLSRWSANEAPSDSEVRARYGLRARPYALYVGSPEWRKNPDGMLAALRRVADLRPSSGFVLAWAGHVRPAVRETLRDFARRLGVEAAVVWLGFVPDQELAALYRGAVCELFVPHWEGFGYPLLEGMASGCAVVASKSSSVGELAGDAALLVDPKKPPAIAEALLTLLDRTAERERLARRGQERARQFALERSARGTLDVYRSLPRRDR